jgi:hypothetical protein
LANPAIKNGVRIQCPDWSLPSIRKIGAPFAVQLRNAFKNIAERFTFPQAIKNPVDR